MFLIFMDNTPNSPDLMISFDLIVNYKINKKVLFLLCLYQLLCGSDCTADLALMNEFISVLHWQHMLYLDELSD